MLNGAPIRCLSQVLVVKWVTLHSLHSSLNQWPKGDKVFSDSVKLPGVQGCVCGEEWLIGLSYCLSSYNYLGFIENEDPPTSSF